MKLSLLALATLAITALGNNSGGGGSGGGAPSSGALCPQCKIQGVNNVTTKFLRGNCKWAAKTDKKDPNFLPNLAKGQSPPLLWIGCSDSRVPETVITNSRPGDIFVHRNIANMVLPNDDNSLAVLDYAVLHVGVSDVVVVGHTKCGGATAAYNAVHPPATPAEAVTDDPSVESHLTSWLAPLIALTKTLSPNATIEDVVEHNVAAQVDNVVQSPIIQNAWKQGKDVRVHGWVYDLETGLLHDLGLTRTKADCAE